MSESVRKRTVYYVFYLVNLSSGRVAGLTSLECTFENETFCGWNQSNFTVTEYETPASMSGPKHAAVGKFYIFFDSTGAIKSGCLTMLDVNTDDNNCLRFHYHMWGKHIGELSINVFDVNTRQVSTVKRVTGNQNNTWHCSTVRLPEYSLAEIQFHVMKDGYFSIIALDDIRAFPSKSCQNKDSCDSIIDIPTTSSTSTVIISSSTSTVPLVTSTQQSFVSRNLPLIVGAPAGLLVVVIMVVGISICCKRRKSLQNFQNLECNQDYTRSSVSSQRYPSLPHFSQETEEYDVIGENYDYIPADYITPVEDGDAGYHNPSMKETPYDQDGYMKPRQSKKCNEDSRISGSKEDEAAGNYTILPAITKPMESYQNDYLSPKNLNLSSKKGKKISISEQGEVCYTDVRENSNRETFSEDVLNKEYATLH